MDSAAVAIAQPSSIKLHRRSRPSGVSGALRCIVSLPGAVWVCEQLHTASGAHFIWGISVSTRSMGRTPKAGPAPGVTVTDGHDRLRRRRLRSQLLSGPPAGTPEAVVGH